MKFDLSSTTMITETLKQDHIQDWIFWFVRIMLFFSFLFTSFLSSEKFVVLAQRTVGLMWVSQKVQSPAWAEPCVIVLGRFVILRYCLMHIIVCMQLNMGPSSPTCYTIEVSVLPTTAASGRDHLELRSKPPDPTQASMISVVDCTL
jgi:hypothetical protein